MRAFPILFLWAAALPGQESQKPEIPPVYSSVTVTSKVDAGPEQRSSEVFSRTLFSRDDQVFHVLEAGINAGQHEGGGKSIEVRRFGFNLDHGGVNGGLKVMVDNVQQNQSTQGHGQGYLGSLKTLSPELIGEVTVIDGPFSAEYGDFSGLGVVHIKLRDELPDQLTIRLQGGSFGSVRNFISYSPELHEASAFAAYELSRSEGPFANPLGYKRDNFTGHYMRRLGPSQRVGLRLNWGRNAFDSSGQIPLDEVAAGRLTPFGYLDATNGGRAYIGTLGAYWQRDGARGQTWKADVFAGRSLVDLFSNFTFYLYDPVNGDAFQQHDSRLQEGANFQYSRPHGNSTVTGMLTAGGNYHDNQIRVGLYSREGRAPIDVDTLSHARVTNGAAYLQENVSLFGGRLLAGGGLRFDEFRFRVNDLVAPLQSGTQLAGRWQPKGSLSFAPARRWPLKVHFNYGRGISTADARAVTQHPEWTRVAITDFSQVGLSYRAGRLSAQADAFLIQRSNEQVYNADDGTFEFKGPTRSYGYQGKLSLDVTRRVKLSGGVTQVTQAFYRATSPRQYVDSAPHMVADAGMTVAGWKRWSGSLRLRAINRYRLDGLDPTIAGAGHTVVDFGLARPLRRGLEFNLTVDNVLNRTYYETQNYFESRLRPGDPVVARIHGTPGYPRTIMVGLTYRGWSK